MDGDDENTKRIEELEKKVEFLTSVTLKQQELLGAMVEGNDHHLKFSHDISKQLEHTIATGGYNFIHLFRLFLLSIHCKK